MSSTDYLISISKEKRRLETYLLVLQVIILFIFGLVVYYFWSMIPGYVFSISNVILVIRTIKEIIVLGIAVIVYFLVYQSIKEASPTVISETYVIIFLTNIALIFGVDPAFMFNANVFYNHIIVAFNKPFNFIYGLTFLVFMISSALILGFIRRGSLELLFTLLIIMYLDVIFLGLFTEVFRFENISSLDLMNMSAIIRVLSTHEILFFVITFILVEFGQVYAFFYSYAKPLSDRLGRLIAQLERVERAVAKKPGRELTRGIEETKIVEFLSPLAKSIIRDAYEGYAFLGEGTSVYVSAKLKSYVKRMREKRDDFFESIAGVLATPKVATIIISLLLSFLTKIGAGLLLVVAAAYLLLTVSNRIGEGSIVEMGRVEAYVYINLAIIALIYLITLFLSLRYKFREREDIKEIT